MEHLLPTVQQFDHTTRAPKKLEAKPATDKHACPFCRALGYRSPGPCKNCGTVGYTVEEPPLFKRSKWKRKLKSDPLVDDLPVEEEVEDIQEYVLINPLCTEVD